MRIAVTSQGNTRDDQVDGRFGRCPWFLIVDTDDLSFEAIENQNVALGGGAGVQSAQTMADANVDCVITGNCGPNAFRALQAAEIEVVVGVAGVVRDAADQYVHKTLPRAGAPNVGDHFGVSPGGRGVGDGMGRGMGRGMSGGTGRGRRR